MVYAVSPDIFHSRMKRPGLWGVDSIYHWSAYILLGLVMDGGKEEKTLGRESLWLKMQKLWSGNKNENAKWKWVTIYDFLMFKRQKYK